MSKWLDWLDSAINHNKLILKNEFLPRNWLGRSQQRANWEMRLDLVVIVLRYEYIWICFFLKMCKLCMLKRQTVVIIVSHFTRCNKWNENIAALRVQIYYAKLQKLCAVLLKAMLIKTRSYWGSIRKKNYNKNRIFLLSPVYSRRKSRLTQIRPYFISNRSSGLSVARLSPASVITE